MTFDFLANIVALIHIGYFLFIVLGTVAVAIGPRLGWGWIRNLPFRLSLGIGLLVLLYVVPPRWLKHRHATTAVS